MFYKLRILQKALVLYCQLCKIKKHLWLNPVQLKNLQECKLKVLLKHTYDNVPYYRGLFNQTGIKPEDIKNIDDLQKIPITSRKTLQALPIKEIVAKGVNIAQCCKLRTSGSTGRPLDIFIDDSDSLTRRLFYLRMYLENGRRLSDKVLVITTPRTFLRKRWVHHWLHRLKILREKYVSLHEEIDYLLSEIVHYQPDIILSCASIIKELSRQIKKRKIKGISPRMIFSTGEMLSNKDRTFISSIFKAEIFDYYASNECGIIAWECRKHSGYHIDSDNVIVELVKNGKPVPIGEEGEVVITALNSYTMPFIRYKLGDICTFADYKCKCGNNFPLIKAIRGRVNDYILLPNGRTISPYILMMAMDSISEVNHYQIIQDSLDKISIILFETKEISDMIIESIKNAFRNIVGNNVILNVEVCKNSKKGNPVKNQVVLSRINKIK